LPDAAQASAPVSARRAFGADAARARNPFEASDRNDFVDLNCYRSMWRLESTTAKCGRTSPRKPTGP
jgi:hypothetical protein